MITTLRSLWAWFGISVLMLAWLPWLALVRLFDRDPAYYRTGRWFRRLGMMMTKVNPAWRVVVTGKLVDDPRRPYVVVSNHQSLGDIPVISCLPWEMKWVAKRDLFRVPVAGWMMRLAGDIALDRDDARSGARALMATRAYLKKRCSVIFFPEGTRSHDGRVYAFTEGAFRIAIKEQVPVLPLAVDGTIDALPKHTWRFGAPTVMRVCVLPPIETTGLTAADAGVLRDRARAAIIAQIAAWRGVATSAVGADAEPTSRSSTT